MKREIFLLVTHLSSLILFSLPRHHTHCAVRSTSSVPIPSLTLARELFKFCERCERNSWKHNEISLPFAISFGFHMVEIVSRMCCCECGTSKCGKRFGVRWRMCEHGAAAITVLQTISSSFWSGSYSKQLQRQQPHTHTFHFVNVCVRMILG